MEARRQSDLERRQLRSGNEPDVLGDRQSESGLERRRSHAGGQPVFRLGHRARRRHRKAEVVLPVHAGRRVRLGCDAGAGARRHGVAGQAAQADAVGQPQRVLLRARSRDREVPDGQAVREADVGRRHRRQWPSAEEPGVLAQTDGRHRRLSRHAGRHELVSAVLQPAHGTVLCAGVGQLLVAFGEVSRRRVGRGEAVHGIDPASGHGRACRRRPAEPRQPGIQAGG